MGPPLTCHRDRSDLFILVKKKKQKQLCIAFGLTHKLSYPWACLSHSFWPPPLGPPPCPALRGWCPVGMSPQAQALAFLPGLSVTYAHHVRCPVLSLPCCWSPPLPPKNVLGSLVAPLGYLFLVSTPCPSAHLGGSRPSWWGPHPPWDPVPYLDKSLSLEPTTGQP